jgi:beta-galactosidase
MIKRREFLQVSLAGIAAASLPLLSQSRAAAQVPAPSNIFDLSPRRLELIDSDWRFLEMPIEHFTTEITNWVWTPGSADQEAMMTAPNVDTSTWKQAASGDDTLDGLPGGWYQTTLPSIAGPGRTVHFECIDDNGTIYLNGQKIFSHTGYASGFDVALDSAWNNAGPNILTVYVENLNGPGGITKPVTAGTVAPNVTYAGLSVSDKNWRVVQLPHDYVVEGVYDSTLDTDHGALPVTTAWYRRHIDIHKADSGKSIWLYFEGVFRNATVYVNGKQVYFQDDGYDPFFVDIADSVNYGGPNVVAVSVDPRGGEGWWYEGGGIYRHVWLNVANPVHVVPWGVYVTSDVQNVSTSPSAALSIETHLTNAGTVDSPTTVQTTIFGPDGQVAATASSDQVIPAGQDLKVSQQAALASAALWSLETRNLYVAQTTVSSNGQIIDKFQQKFGVRTIRFDPNNGFFLNEQPVKIQGVCNHQDFVGVGIGMTDSILYWRMQRLQQQFHANGIRCSHNAMSPAMYDACDELGMLVMDETRHPGDQIETKGSTSSTFTNTDHVEKMIRRDRNHPSVIMWSMANEEWGLQGDPYGAKMLSALMIAVHKHDTTRPVTTATNMGNGNGWLVGFGSVEDLLGVNYNYGSYDWLHQQYPNKPIFGSETASDITFRGNYSTNDAAGHLTSYHSPEGNWEPLATRDFVAGGFAWTGFDYRGETSPYHWPEINSNFGILDMCGFPKDLAFYYKAWWKQDEPLVHLLPHWNWAGKEGQTVPVWCFSNCDSVELFVNGVSQGAQTMPKFRHVEWNSVVYQPGNIAVVGYRNGQKVAAETVETTGPPAAITLVASRTILKNDGEDIQPIEVAIVDSQGRVVPTANNLVTFGVFGAGANAGVGNGDPASHELNQADMRSAFNGLCMVLVRAATKKGGIVVQASSPGLTQAQLNFQVVSA